MPQRSLSLLAACLFALLLPTAGAPLTAQGVGEQSDLPLVGELVLSGLYQELPSGGLDPTALLLGSGSVQPQPFWPLIERIEAYAAQAAAGDRLLLDLSSLNVAMGEPQAHAFGAAMQKVRQAGVETIAYLERALPIHYLLAMSCDRILMADMGLLDFPARALSTMHLATIMQEFGVEMQVTRAGKFKGAVEPYLLPHMSAHLREHYLAMLRAMNAARVEAVSERRPLNTEAIRAGQGLRLMTSDEALKAGWIDAVVPWRGAREALGGSESNRFERIRVKKKSSGGFSLFKLLQGGGGASDRMRLREDSVVVYHLAGTIVDGTSRKSGSIVSGPAVEDLNKLRESDSVKGVVLRIDSPGGSATASEAILLAARELAAAKPTAVSMAGLAASGGYYVAMTGAPIFAEASTITGSIGVFGMRPNIERLAARYGVNHEVVALDPKAASFEDLFSALDDEGLARLQGMVDHTYTRFQDRILEVRDLSRPQLLKLAGGRVWSGHQAQSAGLVDEIGGLRAALANVTARIEGGEELPTAHRPTVETDPFAMMQELLGLRVLGPEARSLATALTRRGANPLPALQLIQGALEAPLGFQVLALDPRLVSLQ